MTPADRSIETIDDETPVDLVEAGVYATSAQGFEHGLVVLAIGYPFWLESSEDQYRLMVESRVAEVVAQQLARPGIEFEQVGDLVELLLRHLERIETLGGHKSENSSKSPTSYCVRMRRQVK